MAESTINADLLDRGGVELTIHGPRATITLARPDSRDVRTPCTWKALRAIGQNLAPEVRLVVIRGEGPAFSAGLDRRLVESETAREPPGLIALGEHPTERADAEIAKFQQAFSWLREPDRVTIAAVRGAAIGAGFHLILACDLRILATDARLRMPETSLGLVPDLGGTLPLVRTVGYPRAVEICLTGRDIPAEEAVRLGLANSVVPAHELDVAVERLADAIVSAPDGAVRETLALLFQADEAEDPEQQLAAERAAQLRRLIELRSAAPTD